MKLLSKNEISLQRTSERKMEIEEGIKLAKKIDLLRKTSSEEEARLAKFREESLKVLHEEIDELIVRRNTLREEIHKLEELLTK